MSDKTILTKELITAVCDQYLLDLHGIHGLKHWARVYDNGLLIAEDSGADRDVVQLFALFHDSCRENDGRDPCHGFRGAELADKFRGQYFDLDDERFELLHIACSIHTKAMIHVDITVQTCFDADRLDLGRVGKILDRDFLSTDLGRQDQTMKQATQRSIDNFVPDNFLGKFFA